MKPWEYYQQLEQRQAQQPVGPWTKYQQAAAAGGKYSGFEKAAYTGRAAAEGLTFGLGDIAAGVSNTPITYLARLFNGGEGGEIRDKATGERIETDRGTLNPFRLFKEGRADFVRDQDEFKKEHSGLNLAGELGGALLPALFTGGAGAAAKGAQGAAKSGGIISKLLNFGKTKAIEGAKTGAKIGAAYGAGSGLT